MGKLIYGALPAVEATQVKERGAKKDNL